MADDKKPPTKYQDKIHSLARPFSQLLKVEKIIKEKPKLCTNFKDLLEKIKDYDPKEILEVLEKETENILAPKDPESSDLTEFFLKELQEYKTHKNYQINKYNSISKRDYQNSQVA